MGKQPQYSNNLLIDAATTFQKNKYCISIVNKSENKQIKVNFPKFKKIIESYTVNGKSKTDLNTENKRNNVIIKKNIVKVANNQITLPPHSFSLFRLIV